MLARAKATAVVMAGRREGLIDPLAAAHQVDDKCLVPVAGVPMIAHVLETLAATERVGTIIVSINDVDLIDHLPQVRRLRAEGRLRLVEARKNLVDSLLSAVEGADWPVFITTADNVLLTPAAADEFLAAAATSDVAVAFARRAAVLGAHPDGQRRFYDFADDGYSNCNSYWIGSAEALHTAEIFRSGGQFAKHPLRILGALGLVNLIRFRFGIGTLDGAFERFSRRVRLKVRPVVLSDGAVAIDVDNERTHRVVEEILARRAGEADRRATAAA